jgi:hypothetical protein
MSSYKFKTTNIKGKEYVEVNQRVKALRTIKEFAGYGIHTELLHLDPESCVVRASIINAEGVVVAQGMAQEDKASSRINQTSYVENCETSAVGRALGFLGIGIDTSIATADEVDMAIKKQDLPSESVSKKPLTQDLIDSMKEAVKAGKGPHVKSALESKYSYTEEQYAEILSA